METILQVHDNGMPSNDLLVALAEKFSESRNQKNQNSVQTRQVWHWFQNKRYALRSKNSRSSVTRDESSRAKNVLQPSSSPVPAPVSAPMPEPPSALVKASAPALTTVPTPALVQASAPALSTVPTPPRLPPVPVIEYEAKSARDGAWYDVDLFLEHRNLETSDAEVQVQYAGFGYEEAEWVNLRKNIRMRSLPCLPSECSAVIRGDLVLCFQDVKKQALYFDAHILDAQRRRHDARGCRCRFLVRYDHDQTEEIVELRKICRRPETNYRLQKSAATDQERSNVNPSMGSDAKISGNPAATVQNQ